MQTRTAALGLQEGLSHSALLCSIVNVLKSHSTLLFLIVIVLKVVAVKTNQREKMEYEFKTTSLLTNRKYEFKILLFYCPTKSTSLKQYQFKSLSAEECLSVNNSTFCPSTIPRGNVTENSIFRPSTIPRGNVTETDIQRERQRDRERCTN